MPRWNTYDEIYSKWASMVGCTPRWMVIITIIISRA